jgi:hypothetical protein
LAVGTLENEPRRTQELRMVRHARARALIAATFLLGALAGCQHDSLTPAELAALSDPFFIRGSITEVGAPWGNLVVGEPGTDYRTDRAFFRISSETKIQRADGTSATAADIRVGRQIKLWITGPIMESYPVQVHADRILIE